MVFQGEFDREKHQIRSIFCYRGSGKYLGDISDINEHIIALQGKENNGGGNEMSERDKSSNSSSLFGNVAEQEKKIISE